MEKLERIASMTVTGLTTLEVFKERGDVAPEDMVSGCGLMGGVGDLRSLFQSG